MTDNERAYVEIAAKLSRMLGTTVPETKPGVLKALRALEKELKFTPKDHNRILVRELQILSILQQYPNSTYMEISERMTDLTNTSISRPNVLQVCKRLSSRGFVNIFGFGTGGLTSERSVSITTEGREKYKQYMSMVEYSTSNVVGFRTLLVLQILYKPDNREGIFGTDFVCQIPKLSLTGCEQVSQNLSDLEKLGFVRVESFSRLSGKVKDVAAPVNRRGGISKYTITEKGIYHLENELIDMYKP